MPNGVAPQPTDFTYNFVNDFLGGVNSYFPPNKLGDNFLTQAQNALINENGILTRRYGITKIGTLTYTGTVNQGQRMIVAGADTRRRIWVIGGARGAPGSAGSKLRTWNGSAWQTPATNDGFSGFFAVDEINMTWLRGSDNTEYIYAVSAGESSSRRWTIPASGSSPVGEVLAAATSSNPPANARYILNAFGRVWTSGMNVIATRDLLTWSAVYTTDSAQLGNETWDQVRNWHGFGSVTGENITGMARYRQNMLLIGQVKSLNLFQVGSGSVNLDSQSTVLSGDIGVGSHRSIANVGEDLLFVDQHGDVRSIQLIVAEAGAFAKQVPLSLPIKDQTSLVTGSTVALSSAAYFEGNYWLSFKQSDGTYKLYIYNAALRHWTGPMVLKDSAGTQLDIHDITVGVGTPGAADYGINRTHTLYFLCHDGTTSTTALQVYKYDNTVTQDAGATDISMEVITKAQDFGFPHQDKEYRWAEVTFKNVTGSTGTVDLYARTERRGGNVWTGFDDWILLHSFDYTGTTGDISWERFSLRALPRSRLLQFKITCDDANTQPEIIRLIVNGHAYDPEDG
jgi:hypothetical protein